MEQIRLYANGDFESPFNLTPVAVWSYSHVIDSNLSQTSSHDLGQSLANSGLKLTKHRQHVFDTVMESHDHPTAEEVFHRTQKAMPEISFATVYNSLSVLVECGLVRQVTLDRSPTRFCGNMRDHCHFYCDLCGDVTDLELPQAAAAANLDLPSGFQVSSYSLSLRGICPKCGSGTSKRRAQREQVPKRIVEIPGR